jgi:FixJ family two-component response regulator
MTDFDTPLIHIVDDDEPLRKALERLLMASGYRVALYQSAADFLARSATSGPGCILLDVNMPELSGLQLQEQLSREHNNLPIIFLTGHGDIPMSVRAIKAGAEDFLSKPVSSPELLDAIQRSVQRYEAAQQQHAHLNELRRRLELLTARERAVFDLLILGLLNKQIAFQLGNAERTVKAHRRVVMEKMQTNSMAELAHVASQLGLIETKAE